jgi:hypothetical protein
MARAARGLDSRPFVPLALGDIVQAQFLALYRAGVRTATDLMQASLDNTERLQQQQLQMVRRALEDGARSVDRLGEAGSVQDIVSINSGLLGAQLDRVTEFWTGVWRAAGEAQKSMIDRVQEQLDQSKETAREAHAAAERSTGDAAEIAASQVAAAVGQARRRAG